MSVVAGKSTNNVTLSDTEAPSSDIPEDALKYWIHCNYCYEIFMKKRRAQYLLSCHHILCQICIEKHRIPNQEGTNTLNITYKCLICSRIVRARLIGNEMPNHLKELFHPTPWLSDVPTARIYKFQSKHRQNLLSASQNLHKKLLKKEQLILERQELEKSNDEELRKLTHENMKLERRVRPILAVYRQRKAEKNKKTTGASGPQNSTNPAQGIAPGGNRIVQRMPATVGRGGFRGALRGRAVASVNNLNRSFKGTDGETKSLIVEQGRFVPNITSFVQSMPDSSFRL